MVLPPAQCQPIVLCRRLVLRRQRKEYDSSFCLSWLPQGEPFLSISGCLHPQEAKSFEAMQHDKRKKDYLLGRYSAKMALALLSGESELDKILVGQGVFNHPVVGGSCRIQGLEVAITHCDGLGAAVAFSMVYPLGIDIERVSIDRIRVMEKETTVIEQRILQSLNLPEGVSLASFWTAKEALSKVLKTGMTAPFHIYEISTAEGCDGYLLSHYRYFTQYCCFTFDWGGYVFSMTCPRETELPAEFVAEMRKISFAQPGSRYETAI